MWLKDFLLGLFGRKDLPDKFQNQKTIPPIFSVPLLCGDEVQTTANATATIIDPAKGLLLTAKHAVTGCTQFMFRYQGTWYLADAVYADPESDLAILATNPEALRDAPKLEWRTDIKEAQVSIRGYIRSNEDSHDAFELRCLLGKIDGVSEELGWAIKQDKEDPENHEGMSGSPVLDQENKLIGIYVSRGRSFLYAACLNGTLLEKIREYQPAWI